MADEVRDMRERKDFSFSPIRKEISKSEIALERETGETSVRLYLASGDEPFNSVNDKRK